MVSVLFQKIYKPLTLNAIRGAEIIRTQLTAVSSTFYFSIPLKYNASFSFQLSSQFYFVYLLKIC